ncbi:MAG: chromosome segregation protein SMC [Myxococcota bacterium]|nr:chromosome segregation protein SMC [Myxococcota bacterium]
MRIKSLQLHGFKSFVDRTLFTYDDGVTAVVGPNGCGKSNVVDAVRWVMGEQSPRKLRGKGMEDVIFAGSDSRPPIGMAEVVLTFENKDGGAPEPYSQYPEIEIARRLYRSGESDYRINKQACRMRDIQDFFRDSGIGAKGYTIVEQGKVAEIVSAKPDERRVLIEEAAGISKFKARRREAESKMNSTEQNLVRVNDVLGEIKRQISSLERQAKKAAKYKRLQETLRVLELSLAKDERSELLDKVNGAGAQWQQFQDRVTGLEANLAERELAVENKRISLTEAEKAVSAGSEALYALRSEIKDLEGRIELSRRERDGIEEGNEGRSGEIEQLNQQRETAEAEAATAAEELSRLEAAVDGEAEAIAAAEAEARAATEAVRGLERDRDTSNEAFVEVLTTIARGEDRAAGIQDRREELAQRLRTTDRDLEVHQTQAADATRDQDALEEGLRNLLAERDRFQDQLIRAMQRTNGANESARVASAELRECRETLEARRARLASLKEVTERNEDVSDGARHLLGQGEEERSRFGVRGLVRDLVEVDRDVERAVEAVLADRAEAIVVDHAEGAVDALAALRAAEAGRGVFVALPQESRPSEGIVPLGTPLIDRVRPHAGYEAVVRRMLDGVYLVADLREAISRYGHGELPATFVTSQGDVLERTGVIRGGVEATSTGTLGRVREVRELGEEVVQLEQQAAANEKQFASAEEEVERAAEALDNLRNRHHTAALAVSGHEKDLDRTKEKVKTLGDAQQGRVAERAERMAEGEVLLEEFERLGVQLEERRVERAELQRALDSLGLQISAGARDVTRNETRVTELRVAHNARVETRDRLRQTAERARGAVRETGEWIGRREREIEAATERFGLLGAQVVESETSLTGKLEAEEQARLRSEALRDEYDQVAVGLRGVEDDVREVRTQLSSQREEASGAELALRENELRLRHQSEQIREKWGIDLASWEPPSIESLETEPELAPEAEETVEGAADAPTEDAVQTQSEAADAARDARRNAQLAGLGRGEREQNLEQVRGQLQSLGDVNLGAIEEHEELAERFRFLSEQKTDLEATIQSLREAISRINRTSRKRFRETFEEVSKRFSENFPRLFGGGQASLQLTDSEDVLEAGIDIMAMPPGKRLQNVNLLSGGEKTMTALALLVAVFQVRPSPFFLLDEVDAALDDANVGRFNQLITELAVNSQFLVITHNKRTIEVADVLYGVTMEQKGVSKVVAVKLS